METRKLLSKVGTRAELFVCGHLLNPLWLPRKERHDRREAVQARTMERYFRQYYLGGLDALPNDNPQSSLPYIPAPGLPRSAASRKAAAAKKTAAGSADAAGAAGAAAEPKSRASALDRNDQIFSIWLQGEKNAPPLVHACFESAHRHCTQPLEVLDLRAIERTLDLPDYVLDKYHRGKIGHAHFADICRVELLHRYGGYWLDATCFVTAPIPSWISREDFFMYLTGPTYGSPYSYVQNCFIRARRGTYLLEAWRKMILDYWACEDRKSDYFQHQLMFKTLVESDNRAAERFGMMPHVDQDPTHVLWETIRDEDYNRNTFCETTSGAFFQKLSFKKDAYPRVGSTLYEMINNKDI